MMTKLGGRKERFNPKSQLRARGRERKRPMSGEVDVIIRRPRRGEKSALGGLKKLTRCP